MLAESAYYRFVFWSGMATPPPASLQTRHTLFRVNVATDRGFASCKPRRSMSSPPSLTDRRRYTATQALGTAMRELGIEAFEYRSARDPDGGIDVALFTPVALASRSPSIL